MRYTLSLDGKMIENPATIYIVRHGQTDWNIGRKIQGHSDIPLNAEGEKQAEALRDRLKNIKFDMVFSSDLLRAKRTAEIIALERELAIESTEVLREGNMGKFEGSIFEDFFPLFNEWKRLTEDERRKHPKATDFGTVEPGDQIASRFITFLREVSLAARGKTILMVSHAGVMQNFLRNLGYSPINGQDYIHIGNAAYIQLLSDGVEFEVKQLEGIEANAE